ncbi:MAG TPA: DUF998 domain-containing protein [Euzebyales bacterium]|nr:DUF998 domain-containing protein [Euzebyales bacterium]
MASTRRAQRARGWTAAARAAAVAALVAAAAVLALHALRRDLEPASHRLSEYAIGPWGWLMTLAFALVAAGVWLLRRALPADDRLRPVPVLLAVASIGFVVSAVFPTDPTRPDAVRETVHSVASSGALAALTAAALWTVTIGAGAIGWRRTRGPAGVATAVAALGVLISPLVHDSPWTGAVQRLLYVSLTVWLLLVCRTGGRASERGGAPNASADSRSDRA